MGRRCQRSLALGRSCRDLVTILSLSVPVAICRDLTVIEARCCQRVTTLPTRDGAERCHPNAAQGETSGRRHSDASRIEASVWSRGSNFGASALLILRGQIVSQDFGSELTSRLRLIVADAQGFTLTLLTGAETNTNNFGGSTSVKDRRTRVCAWSMPLRRDYNSNRWNLNQSQFYTESPERNCKQKRPVRICAAH